MRDPVQDIETIHRLCELLTASRNLLEIRVMPRKQDFVFIFQKRFSDAVLAVNECEI